MHSHKISASTVYLDIVATIVFKAFCLRRDRFCTGCVLAHIEDALNAEVYSLQG